MPTINQLVRKSRTDKTKKSKSPVLNVGFNSMERKSTETNHPQMRHPLFHMSKFITY